MSELGWLLLIDLSGCILVALLLTALTGERPADAGNARRHIGIPKKSASPRPVSTRFAERRG